jgi:hypothetical protein
LRKMQAICRWWHWNEYVSSITCLQNTDICFHFPCFVF